MKKTKLLSLILAMLMLTSSVFAAPVALPTVDSAQETEEAAQQHFPAAEAEVGAESLPEFKPGYNILTKTAEPLTFEGADFTGLSYTADRGALLEFKDKNGTPILDNGTEYYWRTAQVVSSPVVGETNTALEISDFRFYGASDAQTAIAYPSIRFDNFKHPANGRPTLIKFKTFVHDGDIVNRPSAAYRFRYNSYAGAWSDNNFLREVYNAAGEPKWKQVTFVDNQSTTKLAALSWALKTETKNLTHVTKNSWWIKEDAVSPKVYVDDIMYIPYYKVTYMDGDKVICETHLLDDGEGNLLESFNPKEHFEKAKPEGTTMPEGTNAWSLTKDGEATYDIKLQNEDIKVYAVYQSNFKPGINILTGTEEALNFDGAEFEAGLSSSNGTFYDKNGNPVLKLDTGYQKTVTVVASPVAGETDNKALKLSDYNKFIESNSGKNLSCYPTIKFDNHKVPEDGRPVFVSFNSIVVNTDYLLNPKNATSSGVRLQLRGTTNPWNGPYAVNYYPAADTPSAWKKITVKDEIKGRTNLAHIYFFATIDNDEEYANKVGSGYYLNKQEYEPNHYLDDIMYVPYYKVTYMNGDKLVGEKYVLDDGKGNILTEIDPYTQGVALPENKSGWALAPNGKLVTSVPLENKDIVLHAVTEYMDKTVAFFDFESQDAITSYWTLTRYKNDAGNEGADFVENIPGAKNAMKGTATKKDSETDPGKYSYDCQFQLNGQMNIPLGSIDRIEVRVKAENVTERYTNGNIVACENINGDHASFYLEAGNSYYQKDVSYDTLTPDENGWYVINVPVESFTSSEKKPIYECVDNTATVSVVRFDVSSTDGEHYLDYVKLYGKTNDITPIAPYAPENIPGVSFRVDATTGVRFKASMLNETRENTRMTEYGWIVALEETLGVQELTHEFDAKVEGKAFSRAQNIDKKYATDEDRTIFTAVVTGIPVQFADKVLAIRPYSFMNGGYIYGETVLISPREAAQRVKDEYPDFYEENKEYMDSLLGISQGGAE